MQHSDAPGKQAVKSYLLREFLPGEATETLTDSTPLIAAGILDSIATVKLVSYLEETHAIEFEAHEMSVDYLDTLEEISAIVRRKLDARG